MFSVVRNSSYPLVIIPEKYNSNRLELPLIHLASILELVNGNTTRVTLNVSQARENIGTPINYRAECPRLLIYRSFELNVIRSNIQNSSRALASPGCELPYIHFKSLAKNLVAINQYRWPTH
jgi:hypothetical protein